jgi:hypothetical protein
MSELCSSTMLWFLSRLLTRLEKSSFCQGPLRYLCSVHSAGPSMYSRDWEAFMTQLTAHYFVVLAQSSA